MTDAKSGSAGSVEAVARAGEHEIEIKKSRFICALSRAAGEAEAQEFVRQVRKRHWSATHNCYAYVVGEDGRTHKSNDDGEPGGTAGVPMLEVLLRRGLVDTVAVVTRYYGGVKLGAGGLIRAYGSAVSEALDAVGVVERRPVALVTAVADHTTAGRLENDLRAAGYAVRDVRYGAAVEFEVGVPEPEVAAFLAWLAEATAGGVRATVGGRVMVEVRS
ncbi:YigZ family protein [Wenjunlia tyrosinilytica]|uniref:YigZ family protein n=1 Tax=Wenjunlia tyrosinilytica TaxID=1544741 RepID=A0A917ZVM3_9ACTN|nr:YigZ family protein [Wenjunlia tyrosinilytica]GGO92579.1 YigZ family protein [Wenjunlia tyrosinilytica]